VSAHTYAGGGAGRGFRIRGQCRADAATKGRGSGCRLGRQLLPAPAGRQSGATGLSRRPPPPAPPSRHAPSARVRRCLHMRSSGHASSCHAGAPGPVLAPRRWAFDIERRVWSRMPSRGDSPGARQGHTLTSLEPGGSIVYLTGGYTYDSEAAQVRALPCPAALQPALQPTCICNCGTRGGRRAVLGAAACTA
jgi:hypothetical protein